MAQQTIDIPDWAAGRALGDANKIIAEQLVAIASMVATLSDIAAMARFEQDHPTGLSATAFSIIEKRALEALRKVAESK